MMKIFISTLIVILTTILFYLFIQIFVFLWKKFSSGNVEITIKKNIIFISQNKNLIMSSRIAYIELDTRKICLPFDEKYDSISEVYNSFYSCFKILRKLLKKLDKSKNMSEAKLYFQIRDFLNNILRKHLTIYQKPYREWLDKESKKDEYINEICHQTKYSKYKNIIKDIKNINKKADELKNNLLKIAFIERKIIKWLKRLYHIVIWKMKKKKMN